YGAGNTLMTFPTKTFVLDVDKNKVQQMGFIPAEKQDEVVSQMKWVVNKSLLEKKHLVMLDLLATNNWERPVYFSTTVNSADFIGLSEYFQLDGLAYRVVPVRTPVDKNESFLNSPGYLNKEVLYTNLMKEFEFRNFDDPDIFYDENYYRFTANARDKFGKLAAAYIEDGNTARAKELIERCFTVFPPETVPYDYYSPQFITLYAALGE